MSRLCSHPATAFEFAGAEMVADHTGALWWPAQRTLLIADLHLEKASSLARRGVFLPPYDTRTTLDRLSQVIRSRQPVRVVALGDSFHDPDAMMRITEEDRASLAELMRQVEWVWISGNHETKRGKSDAPTGSMMPMLSALFLGGVRLQHESGNGAEPEISGHFHPSASVRVYGRRVTRRCFVTDGKRMILPSFGCYTGGLDVGHPVLRARFPKGFMAFLLGSDSVHALPSSVLAPTSRVV